MFHQPGYMENVSLRLSDVLADIGVNERIVMKRRRSYLINESLHTLPMQLKNKKHSIYFFGSQSEGTTSLGLKSDSDQMLCINDYNLIQDWSDWEPGLTNYLMIQDETVSPGYCLLQRLRVDVPLPLDFVPNEYHCRDRRGRILLNNAIFSLVAADSTLISRGERHGPAHSVQGQPGMFDTDIVCAFHCKTWPQQARQWQEHQGEGQGLLDKMRRYCSRSRCFVVGVGSKGSENEELEWRISTSLAERCLMFNLNMTQIRCYVLMKMILKDFINPCFKENISSFMCKCILFNCIDHTHDSVWRENRLLECFSLCLVILYNSIFNENCRHIFIPGNNLMRGRISPADKPYILDILRMIINSEGRALLMLPCDMLGKRLQLKHLHCVVVITTNDIISGHLILITSAFIYINMRSLLNEASQSSCQVLILKFLKLIFHFAENINQWQELDKKAGCLLLPWFCATLGSSLASLNIQQTNAISAEAFSWISVGLKTDVASNKLKLASMLYTTGDNRRAEIVLIDIDRNYDINNVEPVCSCYKKKRKMPRRGFITKCDNHYEEAVHFTIASCVRFLPCEINCVPTELQHEMFRSTQEDLAFRDEDDYWMDWAVVDSLPYLYLLQYKIFKSFGRQNEKEVALSNLIRTIDQEPNLGHRETALNLLGQCMEQEDRSRDALHCYLVSLNLRKRNNAAKFHICKLLSNMIHY